MLGSFWGYLGFRKHLVCLAGSGRLCRARGCWCGAQGAAAPLVATGLLQHESRLSVLNFAVRKAAGFEAPLPNKAPLLFVTGLRCAF